MGWFSNLFKREQRSNGLGAGSYGPVFPTNQVVPVTEATVLGLTGALCAIRVIGEGFADVPLEVVKYSKGLPEVVENPLADLWNIEPNQEMSGYDFKQLMLSHILVWGNCFAEIVRNGAGQVTALEPLLPNYVRVMRDANNRLRYNCTLYPTMETVDLDQDEVLHVKFISYDGLFGISPLQLARNAFQLTQNTETFGNHWFKNNCKPGGVIEHPRKLSDNARNNIKASWNAETNEAHNANRLMTLEEGAKFTPISIPPEDSQFLQTRQFQLGEIARIYNISPVFLHDLGRATWNNLETLNTMFVQRTLMPWLRKFEQEIKRKLLRNTNLGVCFNTGGLLRGDIATRFQTYATGIQNGIYTQNECRAKENLPPKEGGDTLKSPVNLQPGGDSNPVKPVQKPQTNIEDQGLDTEVDE